MEGSRDERVRIAIQAVNECATACTEAFAGCLQVGGEHAQPQQVQSLPDCAEICRLAGEFLLRQSPNYMDVAACCAGIARSCSRDARAMQDLDVADICDRTVSACQDLAAA